MTLTSFDRCSEDIGILAVVISKLNSATCNYGNYGDTYSIPNLGVW